MSYIIAIGGRVQRQLIDRRARFGLELGRLVILNPGANVGHGLWSGCTSCLSSTVDEVPDQYSDKGQASNSANDTTRDRAGVGARR